MKIEEYYNLKLRRTIPAHFVKLGYKQHVVNINDRDEYPEKNHFKFRFHPNKDAKALTLVFCVEFLRGEGRALYETLDKEAFGKTILKSISPYGSSVSIREDNISKCDICSILIYIKFDPDSWEFINSWRLR